MMGTVEPVRHKKLRSRHFTVIVIVDEEFTLVLLCCVHFVILVTDRILSDYI